MPSQILDGIGKNLANRGEQRDRRVQELSRYAGRITAAEIARIMKCSERAVKCLAQRNSISLAVKVKRWDSVDESFVRKNATTMSLNEIASHLGRTVDSVKAFAQAKNISLMKRGENHWAAKVSDEDVELCRRLHEDGMPVKLIARKMEMQWSHVRNIIYYRSRRGEM